MKKILVALLMVPAVAWADFFDGNKLYKEIQEPSGYSFFVAISYIQGVVDAHSGLFFCPPPSVTAGQARDMVKKHLEDNPHIRHLAAERIIRDQFEKIWPCKARNPGRGA